MSRPAPTPAQQLVAQHPLAPLMHNFIEQLKVTPNQKGVIPAAQTLSAYRRGLEGFILCIAHHGRVEALPDNVLMADWPQTQGAGAVTQPIQMNVRVKAVSRFMDYLRAAGIAVPTTIQFPKFTKAPAPPGPPAVPQLQRPASIPPPAPSLLPFFPASEVPAVQPNSPNQMAQFPYAETPIPVVAPAQPEQASYPVQVQVAPMAPPAPAPQIQSLQSPPPVLVQAAPRPAPAMTQVVRSPPPRPSYQSPAFSDDRSNPLAQYLSQPGSKLRVYLEEEADEPTCVGDFDAALLGQLGGAEPLLQQRAMPRCQSFLNGRAVARMFIIPITAEGRQMIEGKASFKLAVPHSLQTYNPPGSQAQAQQLSASAVADEVRDSIEPTMRAGLEGLNLAAQRFQQVQPAPAPTPTTDPAVAALQAQVAQLSQGMGQLLEVMARQNADAEAKRVAAAQPDMTQMMMLKLLDRVMAPPAAPAAPATPAQSMGEQVAIFAQMKDVFSPQNVSVDTTELEKRMEELSRQNTALITSIANNAGGSSKILGEMKVLREAAEMFHLAAVTPASTFGGMLMQAFQKVVENPEPLAEAASTVLTALRGGVGGGTAAPTSLRDRLPPVVRQTLEAMLSADTTEAVAQKGVQFVEILSKQGGGLGQVGALLKGHLDQDRPGEIVKLLTQTLPKLGYNVGTQKIQAIVASILTYLRAVAAQEAKELEAGREATLAEGEEEVTDGEEEEAGEEGEEELESDDEEEEDPDAPVDLGGAVRHRSPDLQIQMGSSPQGAAEEEEEEEAEEEEDPDAPPAKLLPFGTKPKLVESPVAEPEEVPEAAAEEEIGAGEQLSLPGAPAAPAVTVRSYKKNKKQARR